MSKCVICANVPVKLNKGNLCKECLNEKGNSAENTPVLYNTMSDNTNDTCLNDGTVIDDRAIMDIIKENMTQEKKWNEEMTMILKNQIEYLKTKIIHKNTLIENLIMELHNWQNTQLLNSHHPPYITKIIILINLRVIQHPYRI